MAAVTNEKKNLNSQTEDVSEFIMLLKQMSDSDRMVIKGMMMWAAGENRPVKTKGEITNAIVTASTVHGLSATLIEGVLADALSEIKSQAKIELLNVYNKELSEAQQENKQLKEELEKAKAAAKKTLKTEPDTDQEGGDDNGDRTNAANN